MCPRKKLNVQGVGAPCDARKLLMRLVKVAVGTMEGVRANHLRIRRGNPISFIDPWGLWSLRNQGPVSWPPRPGPGSFSSCVTAECAAGLPPAPSDNRTQEQIDYGQCKLVCNISATPAVAACNVAAGGGLPGAVLGNVSKLGVCSWV